MDSAGALQQLQQFTSGAKSPDQILTDTQGSLGVPAAQQQVQGLRGAINQTTNLLNQVAPGVMGRTQNSLVTNAQANRQIQNEQAPIQTNLQQLGTQYSGANSDLDELERQAEAKANLAYQGQQGQQSYLQNLYNDLYGREQDAAAAAERARAASSGNGLSLGGSSGTQVDPVKAATGLAMTRKNELLGAGGSQPFARERVRDELMATFGLDQSTANNIIYNNVFPDNWSGGSAPVANGFVGASAHNRTGGGGSF